MALTRALRTTLSLAVAASATVSLAAVTATPAAAAAPDCASRFGSEWNSGGRPQRIEPFGATKDRGGRLMSVESPENGTGRPRIWEQNNDDLQLFCMRKYGTNANGYSYYSIRNYSSKLCLDIPYSRIGNGEPVIQYACNGQTNQQLYLIPRGTRTMGGKKYSVLEWQFRHSGKALDVANYGSSNGTQLQQWDWAPPTGRDNDNQVYFN